MKAIFLCFSLLCLVLVGCIGDPTLDTDEAELAVPDAGEEGGIATSPSVGGGGNCTPDEAERGMCGGGGGGGGGGGEPDATFCQLYPTWCPPLPPPGPLPPRTPCSLLDPCPPTPIAVPQPSAETLRANVAQPAPVVDAVILEYRAAELAAWADDVDTDEAWEAASLAANVADEANIIQPGCDAPPTDPYRVCEGDGGGGSGTGGGSGGGTGGGSGGGSTPGGMTCPNGWRYEPWFGYCVHNQYGQQCDYPVGGIDSLETCYVTQNGLCRAFRVGGDCRCPYGYRWIRNHDQPNPTGPQAYVCYSNNYPDPWPNDISSSEMSFAAIEPEDSVVAPCPPDMPPSFCDPEGGGGAGTGGGSGGGGGGSGGGSGGTPGGWNCPAGWRFSARYGQCVYQGMPCNGICDVADQGVCTINSNYICECSGGTGC
jgi:hypothetical protein